MGLIGTQGTSQTRVYQDLFSMRPDIELGSQACPRFVELVEAGQKSGAEVLGVAEESLTPLV